MVCADGSVVTLGGDSLDQVGPDLRALVVGSEGTVGIVTEVTVRLLRKPEAIRTLVADFPDAEQAGNAVSDIVSAGIIPAAVEMLDALAIEGVRRRPAPATRSTHLPRWWLSSTASGWRWRRSSNGCSGSVGTTRPRTSGSPRTRPNAR